MRGVHLRTLILLAAALASGCGGGNAPGEGPRPNLLVVVLDTTRADATSPYGADPEHTPSLAGLAREGIVFENARSTAPWTLPAHASLFTGRYPSRHGAHHERKVLAEPLDTLAELVSPEWQTAGFSENPHITPANGFGQGFEHFEETWRRRDRRGPGQDTHERAIRWLVERTDERPFFAFVNLMDPHLPYAPAPEIVARLVPKGFPAARLARLRRVGEPAVRRHVTGAEPLAESDLRTLRSLYHGDVAQVDRRLGAILSALRELGTLDETLVIVVGDHGEQIGEHGLMEHQLSLYEPVLRVPLLMRLPGVFEPGTRSAVAAQVVDVLPTVLEALSIDPERQPETDGHSLLGAGPDPERPVVAEYMRPISQKILYAIADPGFDFRPFDRRLRSFQRGSFKLIASDRGDLELYDLARDPGEEQNLAVAQPERARELKADLDAWVAALPAAPQASEPTLDPELEQALRALGYLE